jgi:hypothetical protein
MPAVPTSPINDGNRTTSRGLRRTLLTLQSVPALGHPVRMTDALTVSVADLREALSRLLDQVEREYGAEVDLDADFYWVVDRSAAYNHDTPEAARLTVGQLSDDIESLRSMLVGGFRPEAIRHDLGHVIGILSRLAAM